MTLCRCLLRYVPLPKSDTPSRIKSNFEIYDFSLDKDEIAELDAKDTGSPPTGHLAPYNLNCK